MKVLILDTVHGGKVLTRSYLDKGDEVTVVDVYKVTPKDILNDIRHMGAKVADEAPADHFDLVVMPCHCPDVFIGEATYEKRVFFSEAVKDLIRDRRFRIEVTGVKGKTSTCYVLAHILSLTGRKVYLHTSRGMGPYAKGKHFITELKSIAPPMLLTLPKGEYDVMVCEVSLGGSGKADIGCITNLLEDYGIAKNTRKAESAKKDVLCDSVNIVPEAEKDIWAKYGKPLRTYGKRVSVVGRPEFGKPLEVSVDYRGKHEVSLRSDYLALQYLDAMDMALEVCDAMDVPAETVREGLRTFPGVPGRGEVSVEKGVRYLRDRNPGVSHMSVERTLSCLKEMGALDDAVLIIDSVSRKVCDKMDKDLIGEDAAKDGGPMVITDGKGSEDDVPEGKTMVIRMFKEGYQ